MNNWKTDKLESLGSFQYGYTDTATKNNLGVKYLRISDIQDNGIINWQTVPFCKIPDSDFSKYSLINGDVLFARIGATTGKTCYINSAPKSIFASYLIRFVTNELDSKFFFYFTQSQQYWKQALQQREGQLKKGLNANTLSNFNIHYPENKLEQTAIANILSTVDEAIQKADEAIAKTERIKQAIMKKLLSKDLDSIGIKEIGVVSTGKTPSSFDKSLWNGRTPFVTPGDISGSKYVTNTKRTVSDKGSKVATLLPRNSLMVVCIGSTIGKVALTSKDMITNQQLNSIIINEDKFDANFIYYSFLNSFNLFRALAGTAAVPIINKTLFERFKISFISDKKEQTRIGGILSSLDEKLLLQQSRKTKLERIKQGLMDDLFTGKKRVKIN